MLCCNTGIDRHTAEQVDAFIRQGIRGDSFAQMEQQTQMNQISSYNSQSVDEKQDPLDKLVRLADLKQKGV